MKVKPGTKVPPPRNDIGSGSAITGSKPVGSNNPHRAPAPPAGHASRGIMADLGKMTPSLAAGVRRVANSK
jgi:hypothetical protein